MSEKLTLLIVDDDLTNRLVLKALVKEAGYLSLEAENGQEAVDIVNSQHVDIILMDVMMPVMDGYKAAEIIKKESTSFLPIIFLTAMTDENALAKCIDVGGDDFLTKPYNHVLLKSKIESMIRIRRLYQKIEAQNIEINKHHIQTQQEMNVAKKVFQGLVHQEMRGSSTGLKFSMSPMSIFNGDVILAERNQTDGLNVLISDFTGHGLSAALGAIPVSDIFYTMTRKGFSYAEILTEINNKLYALLPTQMFMACAFISVDRENNVATIFNAGIPEIYLHRDGEIVKKFKSQNVPLGIRRISSDDILIEIIGLNYNDRLIAATDGIIEAENKAGELYGIDRILKSIENSKKPEYLFDKILADCLAFCADAEQSDDITLLELCHQQEVTYKEENEEIEEICSSDWSMQFDLSMESMRHLDLLPYIMQGVTQLHSIPNCRSTLHTILTEIYANALDHGVLGLDSAMKNSPEGYVQFYQEKATRMLIQQKGFLKVKLKHAIKNTGGGRLTIQIIDSGDGFDYKNYQEKSMEENQGFSGRGINLIKHLCKEIKYSGNGNTVTAIYEWDEK